MCCLSNKRGIVRAGAVSTLGAMSTLVPELALISTILGLGIAAAAWLRWSTGAERRRAERWRAELRREDRAAKDGDIAMPRNMAMQCEGEKEELEWREGDWE